MVHPLKDLTPGDRIVRVMSLYTHGSLWRNEGTVLFVNDNIISCEVLVDQFRTMHFSTDTGISAHGLECGWMEIHGLGAKSTKHIPLNRSQVVQLLWQAKQAFLNENEREQQRVLKIFTSGIQGMSQARPPTRGPAYQRMKLIEDLLREKAPRGPMGDLPDIFLDYMTLS